MERTQHGLEDARRTKLARVRKILWLVLTTIWVGHKVRRALEGPPGRYSYRPSLAVQLYANLSVWIDQQIPWHKLPVPLALAVMIGDRIKLRQSNLHDTSGYSTQDLRHRGNRRAAYA